MKMRCLSGLIAGLTTCLSEAETLTRMHVVLPLLLFVAIPMSHADVAGLEWENSLVYYEEDGVTKTDLKGASFAVADLFVGFDSANTDGFNTADSQIIGMFQMNFATSFGLFYQNDVLQGAGGSWRPQASLDIPGFSNPNIDSFYTIGGAPGAFNAATDNGSPSFRGATNPDIFNGGVAWYLEPADQEQGYLNENGCQIWIGRFVVTGDQARNGAWFSTSGVVYYKYTSGSDQFYEDVSATISFANPAPSGSVYSIGPEFPQNIQFFIDNILEDGDTIQLEAGNYLLNETIDTNGLAVTIQGATDEDGTPLSILNGQNSLRVLQCVNGETEYTIFKDLVIQHGYTQESGGGLYINPGQQEFCGPSITNCRFHSNQANTGGAIYTMGNAPIITDCVFTDNHAQDQGGAIYNLAGDGITLAECVFERNTTTERGGGAILNEASNLTMNGCRFSWNTAETDGGAITLVPTEVSGTPIPHNSTITLIDCTFEHNSAENGGGMYTLAATNLSLSGCSFIENSAFNGGGIQNSNGTSMTASDCNFSGNNATFSGGGMLCYFDSPATLTGCLFQNNTAQIGGGINHERSNSILTACEFIGNTASNGGGMRNDDSDPSLFDCVFLDGMGTIDCGGMLNVNSDPQLTNCVLRNNTSASTGGGLYNALSTPTLTNCTICENIPDQVWGDPITDGGNNCINEGCLDTDEDGTLNCNDDCPNDPFKTEPGFCGCGVSEDDTDLDGVPDCFDACPDDPLKIAPGLCGCGVPDTDSDGDGKPDCTDCGPSDINNDDIVDGADLAILLSLWGSAIELGDLNGDGVIDGADLATLLADWGGCG